MARGKPFPGEPGEAEALQKTLAGAALAQQTESRSYNVEVVTPIMGGGVEAGIPDENMPIRVKALRGQIRAWWRFLASHGMLPGQDENKGWTGGELYEEEAKRFGGMIRKPLNGRKVWSPVSTSVRISVRRNSNSCEVFRFSKYGQLFKWNKTSRGAVVTGVPIMRRDDRTGKDVARRGEVIDSRLGGLPDGKTKYPGVEYALFSAKRTNDKDAKDLIGPGISFSLIIEVNEQCRVEPMRVLQELELTVAWWGSFGGIGARTRRGAGSVRVSVQSGNSKWNVLCAVSSERKDLLEYLQAKGLRIAFMNNPESDAMRAWNAATSKLRDFRQGAGQGLQLGRVAVPGRSNWPEPDCIRRLFNAGAEVETGKGHQHAQTSKLALGGQTWFPRAAFGLPMRFPFKLGRNPKYPDDPDESTLLPVGSERLASPLIVKAIALPDGDFGAVALVLPADDPARCRKDAAFWATPLRLKVDNWPARGKRKKGISEIQTSALRMWPDDGSEQERLALQVPPMNGRGNDPLGAFLSFFASEKP